LIFSLHQFGGAIRFVSGIVGGASFSIAASSGFSAFFKSASANFAQRLFFASFAIV
jgi:hypothetical protein